MNCSFVWICFIYIFCFVYCFSNPKCNVINLNSVKMTLMFKGQVRIQWLVVVLPAAVRLKELTYFAQPLPRRPLVVYKNGLLCNVILFSQNGKGLAQTEGCLVCAVYVVWPYSAWYVWTSRGLMLSLHLFRIYNVTVQKNSCLVGFVTAWNVHMLYHMIRSAWCLLASLTYLWAYGPPTPPPLPQ